MIYDFKTPSDNDGVFTSSGTVISDKKSRGYKTNYYGHTLNKPLEFTLVFGAKNHLIDNNKFLDRWDIESIGSWLTGLNGYKWLEIEQPDMETMRFRCVITELRFMTVGWLPWAFNCKVVCDSPFAYTYPEEFIYSSEGSEKVHFYNRSSYNGFYYPQTQITLTGSNSVSIVNHSDNDRMMAFTNLPSFNLLITIDNENGVITNNLGLNLYRYFSFEFLRFARGDNLITINGDCNVKFICEFPVNIGG